MNDLKENVKNAIEAVFEYDGKRYVTRHDRYIFDEPEYYEGQWRYIWEEGNYSCDCNRALFIVRQCDVAFPEFKCGDKIKMVSLKMKS